MTLNAQIMTGEFGLPSHEEELNINDEIFLQRQDDFGSGQTMESMAAGFGALEGANGMTSDLASNFSSRSSLANLPVTYSTTNTTPELSSPPKLHPVGSSFSLPIDQLNLLSLKSMSSSQPSKSPSPEYNLYSVVQEPVEEKTINPRQLFTGKMTATSVSMSPNSKTAVDEADGDSTEDGSRGYILPSSSSPSLSTLFNGNQRAPYPKAKSYSVSTGSDMPAGNKFDFIMNNECFNAILYWINDTLQNVNSKIDDTDEELGGAEEIMVNPTGIIKSNYYKRRNSIQLVTPTSYNQNKHFEDDESPGNKKKRRKSYNHDYAMAVSPEDEPTPEGSLATTSTTGSTGATVPALAPIEEDDEQDKPFPCPDCPKQFKRSEHLKRHIRSVHSNIRPFHCKYCDKKFSRSDNLAQHLKTHYKVNTNGSTTIIYGNPNLHNRGGRKKLSD